MIDLNGKAWRVKSGIVVQLAGTLNNSCERAVISDIYPGGNIQYVKDPGHAEVFVTTYNTGGPVCLQVEVPWFDSVLIPTQDYKQVVVKLNDKDILTLDVQDVGDIENLDILPWQVIARVGITPNDKPPHYDCGIVSEDAVFPAIYSRVFGPASYQECEEYVAKNCKSGCAVPAK